MATADEYAAWIVKNAAKRGTPEFDTVAQAYQFAKQEEAAATPAVAAPSEIPAQRKERGFFETIGAPIEAASEGIIKGGGNVMFGGQRLLGMGLEAAGGLFPEQQTLSGLVTGKRPLNVVQQAGSFLQEDAARRLAESQSRVAPFKQEFPISTGAGELGAEIAATYPIGGMLAAPLRMVPAAAPLAQAIRTGGFSTGQVIQKGTPFATRAVDISTRALGGATLGGATAAVLNPEDTGMGAAIGAAIPAAVPVVKAAVKFFKPGKLIDESLANALNNDPALMTQVKSLLDQGYSIQDVAAITKSSGLAAFVNKSKGASNAVTDLYNQIDDALASVQKNQLATATQNVNALTQRNLPIATASPTAPRRAVKQALAGEAATLQSKQAAMTGQLTAEQQAAEAALQSRLTAMTGQLTAQQQAAEAALAAQRQSVEGGIANVSQLDIGKTLSKSAQEGLETTRRTVIEPAYQKAFDAAPDATIDLSNLAGVAKEQRGELLTQLKGLAPESATLLERYGPKEVETIINGVPVKQVIPPAPITLEQAHQIRQAINIDRAAIKGSNESGANITRKRLNELYTSLNNAIERNVAPEAKLLFNEANDLFKERIVNVYRTGQPSNLSRISTLNEPMLRPGDIVSKAMVDEGSTLQFLKVFKQDPAAMQNLKTGVEDLYRQQVLAGGKAATPEAHAKFMFDNARQLGALDNAGLDMSTRLNQIGGQVKGLTAAEQALTTQGKAIPSKVTETFKPEVEKLTSQGKAISSKVTEAFKAEDEALKLASTTLGFKQTDKLRSAIVSNPETASQALSRMDAPAKSSLARGVMQDAGKTSDPLKHLVDNEQGIMRVLTAHNPKTAAATFATAKDAAELANIIKETGNKLGVKYPDNAMVTQQNLNNLTQGLPDVQKAVQQIQQQIQRGEDFSRLATQGDANVLSLFSKETKPHMFPLNKVWAIANAVLNRVEGKIDKKLAVQIATELANPNTASIAVQRALNTKTTRPINLPEITRGAAAISATEQEIQNALAK